VLFNRSWYNRAGVEMVMGFCTPREHESFMEDAPRFEKLLIHSGTLLRKYYLDIGKTEQKRRLADRARNPLKQWKLSPIDDVAVKNWEAYSAARNEMLARTHTAFAPWEVVRSDDKRTARLNVIKSILASLDYKGKDERLLHVNPEVVFRYEAERAKDRRIAP
jgi:polyphosphate kinase